MSADTSTEEFCCLGLNHRTAPVAVRERFAVPERRQAVVSCELAAQPSVGQCVLLSTCNRTEVYYTAEQPKAAAREVMAYFLGEQADSISTCFYSYTGSEALAHLAAVAAGLDSMVIGETEIFGQLKNAYRIAAEARSVAGMLHRIFQHIFTIGKSVRSATGVTSGPTSVGAAAVLFAQRVFGELAGANVLVVGAGDVARATAQSLRSRGARSIFVANRSYDRAAELAERVGGRVIRFAEWVPYLTHIDIVIVSTAAPVYVVSPSVLETARVGRQGRPLMLIDLSVPRNVDPRCGGIEGVQLYDIDALQSMAEQSLQQRALAVEQGMALIREWVSVNEENLLHRRPIGPDLPPEKIFSEKK